MTGVRIHDKDFVDYISSEKIQMRIAELGKEIQKDFNDKNPVFLGILNGCFRFSSDLLSHIDTPCEINFLKVSSYSGTETTGKVSELIGLNTSIKNRHIVILEDIVDTGHTIDFLLKRLKLENAASISIATLLYKPDAYHGKHPLKYVGFEIPNLFVVGYGLDYDGFGRNLNDIYQIKN